MMDRANVTDEDLHAYVDGALSESRRAQIETLIEADPVLASRVRDYLALNSMLHERYGRILDEPVPARLQQMLPPKPRKWFGVSAANWPRFAALAATLTLGIGIGAGVQSIGGRGETTAEAEGVDVAFNDLPSQGRESADGFVRKAALAHVVYMPEVEVPKAADAARELDFVKWLTSRLGTDVRPPNLERSGFRLAGGRLLPDADGSMAQFMYRNALGERVTLCISHRKASARTVAFKLYEDGPVKVFYWIDGQYGYAVSGGIDRATLLQLSRDVYAQHTADAR